MINLERPESPTLSSYPFEDWCESQGILLSVASGAHKAVEEYHITWNALVQATYEDRRQDAEDLLTAINSKPIPFTD